MTVSKRGRVPQTIKEAIQEQFSRMGESYSANIKWGKSVNAHYFNGHSGNGSARTDFLHLRSN
ncbi:TPA: hypothetical protein RRT27_005056 [Klebsiella pneumoniae]|nr:hypothetical protein [Klebsiella pneumoniae]